MKKTTVCFKPESSVHILSEKTTSEHGSDQVIYFSIFSKKTWF